MSTMSFHGVIWICVFASGLLPQVAGGATLTLPEALDATNLVWVTGGHSPWFAQATNTLDQSDAAQSGPLLDNQTNWIRTSVSGPGTISFWWKVSSETTWDSLVFSVNGTELASISGDVGWEFRAFRVGSGLQILRWLYQKDAAWSRDFDAAWVDQAAYVPDTALAAPTILTAPPSAPVFRQGQGFSFAFRSQQGIAYVAEQKSDLGRSGWTVVTNVLATGSTAFVADPTPPATNRFYRVRLP
jgi:hypothetical protein